MSPEEAIDAMRQMTKDRKSAERWYEECVRATPEKEREYRVAKAKSWVTHRDGTAAERIATVDADTADLRYERDIAAGIEKVALEKVRGHRQDQSMFQTWLAYGRAVAELHRFDEGAS